MESIPEKTVGRLALSVERAVIFRVQRFAAKQPTLDA